jgi:hypothetical protein
VYGDKPLHTANGDGPVKIEVAWKSEPKATDPRPPKKYGTRFGTLIVTGESIITRLARSMPTPCNLPGVHPEPDNQWLF